MILAHRLQLRLALAPGDLVRQALGQSRQRGGDARGLAHGHGIAGDAVAGVRDEIAADAAARHHEAIDILRDQGAQRDVVGLHVDGLRHDGVLFVVIGAEGMHVDAEGHAHDGVVMPHAFGEIVLHDGVAPFDAAAVAHADLLGGGDDLDAFPRSAERAQAVDHLVHLGTRTHRGGGDLGGIPGLMPYS
jgi:hypothetical protein